MVAGGACTSLGSTLPASAAAVRAGISSFQDHPFMVDSAGKPMVVGRAPYIAEDVAGCDRLLALALPAAGEALAVLTPFVRALRPVAVMLGMPPRRPGCSRAMEDELLQRFQQQLFESFPVGRVDVIACGHSAGLMALETAWETIRSGAADFCLIGGVDSYLEPETLEWLEESEQLHSAGTENNAWGFVPGEAAGFCLVASEAGARRWQLDPLGSISALAVTREPNVIKSDTVCLGHGLTAAFEKAFGSPVEPVRQVDEIICDMNGEPYRAEEFGFATIRTHGYFVDSSAFQAPADCWGDVGAASGPLFLSLAAAAHAKGYATGTRTLAWTSSESGERAAAILDFDEPSGAGR
jgi:3-oxoacyl-[acyl-carrier-protein] synthase I